MDELIGKYCIVRDHMAGVFAGTLVQVDLVAGTWVMHDARKIHYWAKAAAAAGIAKAGPGPGSRVCPVQPVACGRTLVELLLVSETGAKVIQEYEEWTP